MGGYAGDALPLARALAQAVDGLITHPNVLNGAQLYWPRDNILYVEGYALDQFAAGHWALRPVRRNCIGLVLDRAMEPDLRQRHVQVAEAARATLGLDIADYILTDEPLGVALKTSDSGASWGTIARPDSLLRATEKLIQQTGAEAIAVVARFPDEISDALQDYRQGQGVDGLAGAEAIISHLVVQTFQIPCAHAPALRPLPLDPSVSPRAAAEEIGYTFLPCVLVGLSRAPRYESVMGDPAELGGANRPLPRSCLTADHINSVIVPAAACGGSAILSWSAAGAKIIAVEENTTALDVPPEPLGIQVIRVRSYLEAIGVVVSDRAGLDPTLLRPHIPPLRCLEA
ncbi:MAG: DUF3326 domain-containing protein [Synechococcales cyanobacterium CRU_2_2]|nr:DUF3326 domain-containing protein [Synechococcales cyanobacterium CRU_2_2]